MCQLINAILISVFSIVNCRVPNYVELLNTETSRWNDWVKNSGKYDGWRSQNIPPNAQLVYGLCALQGGSRDNWLRSPFIRRDDALSIKIEISFTMRSCKSRPEQRLNCEDTLYLMIYEADSSSDVPSSWNDRIYTRVDIISPDITWTDVRQDENIVNVKTYSIEPRRSGFFIALRDIGACAMVKLIRIYYVACPSITHLFARYSRLVISHDFRIRNVKGICVDGAELISLEKRPQLICQPTGQWHISDFMFCHCKPGYTSLDSKMVCIKCPHNTYKSSRGSEKCIYCPKYSYSDPGADKCVCNEGLFPIKSSSDLISCAEPLLSPRNLKGNFTDKGQLQLSWDASHIIDPSISIENSFKVHFRIICISCKDSEQLFFTPGPDVSQSSVLIDALESGKTYKFSVTSMSSVSHLMNFSSANPSSALLSIDTKPADQSLQLTNLVVQKAQNKRSLFISWSLVSEDAAIISYEVIIHKSSINAGHSKVFNLDSQLQNVKTPFYEFPFDKSPINSYRIKVRARSKSAWGPFVVSKQINLKDLVKLKAFDGGIDESNTYLSSQNKLMIISVFGMGFILMLIAIPLCFYCRYLTNRSMKNRKKKNVNKTFSTSLDMANYSQIHAGSSTTRIYIDPSNYEDPSTIVQEFAHEIDPEKIHIETVIGEGEFGEVCRGKLIKYEYRQKIPVAIKTLKSGCSEKERMNFLMEAAIMGQFCHSNIIQLEGIVTKTQPIMIITQFIEFGSLDTFLRKKKYQFSTLQLLVMLRGIVSGMKYLSEMRYVHRDLAARNILVDKDLCCKVSDFGLSREIEADNTEGAYTTKGGLIPIRWTAPEAINYRRFTSSSDVWSFGIVMWEVMSYGERPYWNWPNKDVLQSIESGYRLPAPKRCPPAIHLLMLDCWTYERSERPKFGQIFHSISALLRCPEALASIPLSHSIGRLSVDSYRRNSSIISESKKAHFNSTPLLQSEPIFGPESSISQWLDCLDLPCYKDNFVKHHLIYLCHICKFSRNDLVSLEITDPEHLQKLMNNIEAMQNYFDTLQSASFAVL